MHDPELGIQQSLQDYKRLGYSDNWINQRLKSKFDDAPAIEEIVYFEVRPVPGTERFDYRYSSDPKYQPIFIFRRPDGYSRRLSC